MYVVSGLVAKEMAGPGVIVSFIIAAVASILSGKPLDEAKAVLPGLLPFLPLFWVFSSERREMVGLLL